MPMKRKASSLLDTASDIKRSRLNNKPSEFVCDLCTSNSTADLFKMKGYDNGMLVEYQCHLTCVEIIPETHLVATGTAPKKLVISDHANYHNRFSNMTCVICAETHGAKIYCTRAKCAQAFHISCAQSMEEISLKVRKDDDVLPYRLSCHLHGTSSSSRRKLTQDAELRANAMRNAKRGDTIVVRFPGSGSAKYWVVDVNETTQEVKVLSTTENIDAATEHNVYTAKWNAIVVNDLLRRLASTSHLPSKNNRLSLPTGTTTISTYSSILLTPPPDQELRAPIEDKFIEDTLSPTSVAGSPESCADSEETLRDPPPSSVPSEVPDLDLSILSKTPGLVEAYAMFMFQDARWDKLVSEAMVLPK